MAINFVQIGKHIGEIRKRRGLSQQKLSEIIDKSPTYVSYIEGGLKCMSLDTFVSIANACNGEGGRTEMSGGCWNYMNDSAASEILGYHIYVGYGLDSDKHEKNYKQVVRDNPLGDPEISALVYDVFCLLHSYDWAESGDTDMDAYQKDVEIFKSRWFKKARKDRIKEMIDISTEKLKEVLYQAFGFETESSSEP